MAVTGWRRDALCTQIDVGDMFYPEKGGSTVEAKRVCFACPVRALCRDDALAVGERFGIWGGLTERERRKVRHGVPVDVVEAHTIRKLRGEGAA